jgi:hypothetical protein
MSGFFAELKRRKVLQIGGGYIAVAWLVTEVLSFLFDQFQAPDWVYRLIAITAVGPSIRPGVRTEPWCSRS